MSPTDDTTAADLERVEQFAPCEHCAHVCDWTPCALTPTRRGWVVSCEHCGEYTTAADPIQPADDATAPDLEPAAVVVEPPEGADPRPGDFWAIHPGDLPPLPGDPPAIRPGDFNPADPSHLATFAAELSARVGVQFIPSAKERPGDPTAVYANGATRTVISVGFPHPCEFWAYLSVGSTSHVRTGRSYGTGPVALAWVVSRILAADLRPLTTTTTAAG